MPKQHAILSPSGAHRWMICTPSARLEQQFPDQGSDYAAEGTLAHAVAELKVKKQFSPMGARYFSNHLKKLEQTPLYDHGELRDPKDYWPEILRCTDEYLDYINKTALSYKETPYVAVEQQLDVSTFAPECFGTGDCIIIGGHTLHIIDYKHGAGVMVEADHNPQMMIYALGAIERYGLFYDIHDVMMTIVQPRAQGETIKEWSIGRDDLINWGALTLRPAAEAAFKGEGEFVPGDHCRFCRARQKCRARTDHYTAIEDFGGLNAPSKAQSGEFPRPPLLSDAEVGDVLTRARGLEAWKADLEDYALSALLDGREVPGWKAVEGRKSRVWDDQDAAFAAIKAAGVNEAILYKRMPLTLAAIEKALGKKDFTEAAGAHVIQQPGKPALAAESDQREAIVLKPSAEEDFSTTEDDLLQEDHKNYIDSFKKEK
jgi:hypothetical protein